MKTTKPGCSNNNRPGKPPPRMMLVVVAAAAIDHPIVVGIRRIPVFVISCPPPPLRHFPPTTSEVVMIIIIRVIVIVHLVLRPVPVNGLWKNWCKSWIYQVTYTNHCPVLWIDNSIREMGRYETNTIYISERNETCTYIIHDGMEE